MHAAGRRGWAEKGDGGRARLMAPHIPGFAEARLRGKAALETFMPAEHGTLGRPTRLSCPQCGGVLNEVTEEGSTRFRCQVGHAFTEDALMAAQNDELERALESAMRIHRDRVSLFRRMQHHSEQQSMLHAAARWRAGADESDQAATLISQALDIMRRPPE